MAEPLYLEWDIQDRQRAIAFLDLFESPDFKVCEWVRPEPYEKDGKKIEYIGWPEYDPRVFEFLDIAWNTQDVNPYDGEPWEPFWIKHCTDPDSFADASIGDIRRYLLILKRRERFGDGSIEAAFRRKVVHAALRRLNELTPDSA